MIHTYKYKEIQQTRKNKEKNKKCNVQVFIYILSFRGQLLLTTNG